MSSQWRSQKLLQGLVSHELTVYLSIFNLFKLNELWPYYQKHVNQIILNRTTLWSLALRIFEAFIQILLIVNLSLNQTLLIFLLCVRQTWMTQLILAISLWGVIFSNPKGFCYSYARSRSLCKDCLLHGTYLQKTLRILTYVFEWLNYTQYLTPFSSINHLLCLCAQFLIIFHLTWWGSVDHSIC